jgi:N-acetylglucosamine-6-phosphate deacetylase
MLTALTNARVFDGHQCLEGYAVVLNGSRIHALLPEKELDTDIERQNLEGGVLAPGFIDLQVNGGGGILFNNSPDLDGIRQMLEGHRNGGTTSMTPTLISDLLVQQQRGVAAVCQALVEKLPGVLGVHIEGPFFNPDRRGTHKQDYIRPMSAEDLEWLASIRRHHPEMTLLITLAPEQTKAGQIQTLADAGIRVCAGHTDANHEQIKAALAEGLSGFTHLYNAMRPLTGRDPGVVGAALADNDSWCGIIADGHHVDPTAIQVALNAKAAGKVFLVTDAMATVGSNENSFSIYDEVISEQDGCLVNAEGNLAGSAIGMIDAVRFCVESVGVSLQEALRMASLYPAQYIGKADQLGRIHSGYRADLVHFDDAFRVQHTWVAGSKRRHMN